MHLEADIESRDNAIISSGPNSPDLRKRVLAAEVNARTFEQHSDLVLVLGADQLLLYVSASWRLLCGAPTDVPLGLPVAEALDPKGGESASWKIFERAVAAAHEGGSSTPIPLAIEHPENGCSKLEGRFYGPFEGTRNSVVVFHDVTARLDELSELAESERRFRTIAEATDDMVTETNDQGRFMYVSPACSRVLGYSEEEFLSRSPLHIHHDDEREEFRRQIISHQTPDQPFSVLPHRLRRKDGSWIWVEATAIRYRRPTGELRLIGVARDITARLEAESARRQLEEQLRGSQKLESLGILAGGIAHDFNNFLTPIVGMAGMLHADLPEDSPLRPRVDMIRKAARRATNLTAQMLAYAGSTEPRFAQIDVSAVILDMQLLLESTATHNVELMWALDRELPCVDADDGQIGQIAMNLVSNAAEALGDEGGCIEIRTGQLEADRELLRSYHLGDKCGEGVYVYLEVRDDGAGIDEETRRHIFDPFFSTKFTGRGLGLAVVLGIVKSHRGALQIHSGPDGGARFRVILPATAAVLGESGQRKIGKDERGKSREAPGTILVVDDDEGAREFTSIMLGRAGFDVLTAADGVEAVETFSSHAGEISCVVLDNTMPGMSGAEVFESIRKIQTDVPIILASGYSRERVSDVLLGSGAAQFLRKPFDASELLSMIGQLLASR